MIDSVSWACRDCRQLMIGQRPPDDLCPRCVVVRLACEVTGD